MKPFWIKTFSTNYAKYFISISLSWFLSEDFPSWRVFSGGVSEFYSIYGWNVFLLLISFSQTFLLHFHIKSELPGEFSHRSSATDFLLAIFLKSKDLLLSYSSSYTHESAEHMMSSARGVRV